MYFLTINVQIALHFTNVNTFIITIRNCSRELTYEFKKLIPSMDYFIYVRKFYQYVLVAMQFDNALGLIVVCWWYCPRNDPVNGNLNCSKLWDEAPS